MANDLARYTGKEQTLAVSRDRVSQLVGTAADESDRVIRGIEKVPLSDLNRVQTEACNYLRECSSAGSLPTVRGVAARLGVSRAALYDYRSNHPYSEFSEWLEDFSDLCAELMMQAAVEGVVPAIPAIFVTKARYGWRDAVTIETPVVNDPLGRSATQEELAMKYSEIFEEDS